MRVIGRCTGSWDESIRLWYRPGHPSNASKGSPAPEDAEGASQLKVSLAVFSHDLLQISWVLC